jgi:ArsR family metal-binding transcriptional regulator
MVYLIRTLYIRTLRRVAAMSVAKRVAEEMDVELGQQVSHLDALIPPLLIF